MTSLLNTSKRRRTLLQLIGATASASSLRGTLDAWAADFDGSVVLEQGDRCIEITPLSGDEPVEDLYDYTYPLDRFSGPPGSQGYTYSSEGTTDLQRDRTSILFLYDGPDGLSLVVVHGHLDGDRDAGGTVTFTIQGLSEEATWTVRDDYYLEDGEQAESNFDRLDGDGDEHVADWAYRAGRTDGGAVRNLGSEFDITIEPAFNDEATLSTDHDYGPIEGWEALAGDRDEPDRFPLRLDLPVTIRTGTCGEPVDEGTGDDKAKDDEETGDDEGADDDHEETENDEETGDDEETEDEEATGDDEGADDDERSGKHERKQRKHREKHERKQQKHREKHERKQAKHERKREKHQEKHRKKQRKHRKHGD